MANTVSKLANTGTLETYSYIDEVTNNPAAMGSISFNGSSQYLSAPSNAAFTLGTGDFTIECWVYPTTLSSYNVIIDMRNGTTLAVAPQIYLSPILYYNVANVNQITGPSITVNTWYHIAVSRSSGVTKMFVNGSQVGSSYTDTNSYILNSPKIGITSGLSSGYYAGYISNLRVVKGTALYTSAFTPSNLPLTPVVGTSLLLNTPYTNDAFLDSSPNAFTVTNVSSALSIASTPFAYSYYGTVFNGSTQRLTTPTSSIFNLYNTTFTLECWIYMTANPTTTNRVITIGANALQSSFCVQIDTSGNVGFVIPLGGTTNLGSTPIPLNTWTHLAFVMTSTTTAVLYKNGVVVASGTVSAFTTFSTNYFYIGYDSTATVNGNFTGFVNNVRLVKGATVYTSAFTPPTTNLSNITGTTILTCQSQTFVDNSTNETVITNNGGVTTAVLNNLFKSAAQQTIIPISKHYSNGVLQTIGNFDEISLNISSTGSIFFNGSSYVTAAYNPVYNLGTNNFTVEFWIYFTNVSLTTQRVAGQDNNSTTLTWGIGITSAAGTLSYYLSSVGTSWNIASAVSMGTVAVGQWYHVALVRNGSTFTPYLNGVAGTPTVSSSSLFPSSSPLALGGVNAGSYLNGYISNFRLVNGTAVYIVVEPTSPLTTTSQGATATQVSLLTAQSSTIVDNSLNNYTLTNVGSITPTNSTIPFSSTYSYPFNGTSQYLTWAPGSSAAFGTGDFTVEALVYMTTAQNAQYIIDFRNSVQTTAPALLFNGSKLSWYNGSAFGAVDSSTIRLGTNTWHHVVYQRKSNVGYLLVDGSPVASGADATNYNISPTLSYIGSYFGIVTGGYWPGYISNLRIVKGTSIYNNGSFTPPTTPFNITQPGYTSGNIIVNPISNTASTSFLLRTIQTDASDISIYNNIVSKVGSPTNTTLTPFANTTYVYPAVNGYYSNYFNGSSYLTVPASTNLVLYGSNYTIEFWIYPTLINGTQQDLINKNFASTYGYTFRIETDNTMTYYTDGGSIKTTALTANRWYHVAATWDGTTTRLFLNGFLANSSTTMAITSGGDLSTQVLYIGARAYDFSMKYNGYISNIRIIKGSANYISSFSPQNTPLTAISGTQLLTAQSSTIIDNSPNAFTITNSGQPVTATQTVVPTSFTPTAGIVYSNTVVKKLYNTGITQIYNQFDETSINPLQQGSVLLSGTQYLLTPPSGTNTAFTCTGNFTVEGWFYPTVTTGSDHAIFCLGTEATNRYVWYISNGGGITSNLYGSGTTTYTVNTIPANAWVHIAIVRSGSTVSVFVNGVLSVTTDTQSGTIGNGSLKIGSDSGGTANFLGYISNFRLVNGIAVYTGTFTPPAMPLITTQASGTNITGFTNAANTSLLLGTQYNTTISDSSTNAFTITNNNGATLTAANPFYQGYNSVSFNGSSQYLTVPNNTAFNLGTTFTIEFWVYRVDASARRILSRQDSSTPYNGYNINYGETAGNYTFDCSGTQIIFADTTINTWVHFAWVVNATSATVYKNGVSVGTATQTAQTPASNIILNIGRKESSINYWSGYISNLRIIKGTAVYTSNFLPPTNALTSNSSVSLLTCQAPTFADSSNNNFTITATASPTITNVTPFYPNGY